MKWIREQEGPTQCRYICDLAARKGHLEVLKWLYENNYPQSQHVCITAAKNGHLDVMKWAHRNGCPWNKVECINELEKYASVNHGMELLERLRKYKKGEIDI